MGTMGTLGTQNTALTMEATRTQETSDGAIAEAALFDDEGNAINPVLLEKAKRHREQRKKEERAKATGQIQLSSHLFVERMFSS